MKNWDVKIYRGILTGYNEAFIIDGKTKDKLIILTKNAEIIRPILKGRNIKRYLPEFDDLWIIFSRRGINIDSYPAVKEHLAKYYEYLKPKTNNDEVGRKPGNYKWYEIQDNVAYYEDFLKDKVHWIELSDAPKFSYDDKKYFPEATAFIMTGKYLKYLTAFLNSKVSDWYFDKITTTSGVGTNRWKKIYIENFPIPEINQETEKVFNNLVDSILDKLENNSDITELDDAVNNLILDLYDFEPAQKEIILNFRSSDRA